VRLLLDTHAFLWLNAAPERIGAEALAIEHAHALGVASLPPLHRDPFDRLLIAQARSIEATLVTADRRIAEYPVRTLMF
jgi:PIN domain nuclease of toxin-antitoxin system